MRKPDPRQLDLMDWLTKDAKVTDYPLRHRLITDGFANDYSLEINKGLMHDSGEGVVHSRLCSSPVFYECVDGYERVVLRHPRLTDQPLPKAMMDKGYKLEWAGPFHPHTVDGRRMHAQDLSTNKHHDDLMRTPYLTTVVCVYDAIVSNLPNLLSAKIARKLMVWTQTGEPNPEPADRSAAVLATGMLSISGGGFVQFEDRKYSSGVRAWAALHALEDGWVRSKGHMFYVTEAGRERQLETA